MKNLYYFLSQKRLILIFFSFIVFSSLVFALDQKFISKNNSGYHQWLIEFEKAPSNISKFCEDLDKNLQKSNSDYKSKRFKNITMKRLEIIVAKQKLFFEWLKFNNKLGGQNKIPRLCNDRVLIEELMKLN